MTAPVPIREQIEALLDVAGPNDPRLQAAVRTLRLFERFEGKARTFFSDLIAKEKLRAEQASHPVVQKVLAAFDGKIIETE